jgi:hypothetical protein
MSGSSCLSLLREWTEHIILLPRVIDGSGFPDHCYLDLSGVLQTFLDLFGNIARELQATQIIY